jgi:formate dehydrogenase iron-sulfur subunit
MAVAAFKLTFEASLFRHLRSRTGTSLNRSARLMVGPLSNTTLARFGCGVLGGLFLPALILGNLQREVPAGDLQLGLMVLLASATCLIGEMLERYLFFAAVAAPRMPGAL